MRYPEFLSEGGIIGFVAPSFGCATVKKGEFVAIVGTSGSGKSTLLHMLGGLDRPTSGTVMVDGQDIFSLKEEALTIFRRRKIGFVFQSYNLVPVLNVYENIILPIELDGGKVNKNFVQQIVQTLGLSDRLDALPNQLSGGQQQRVAIARALAAAPAIILADEPTGNLDSKTSHSLISTSNTIIVSITTVPQPLQLRENEPHPMAPFSPVSNLLIIMGWGYFLQKLWLKNMVEVLNFQILKIQVGRG